MVCRHKIHCIVKKSFSCSNCKKCFTRKDSLDHLKVCTEIKAETKCTLCLKEFKFLCNLKRHMKQVHKTEKKSWSCKNMAKSMFWKRMSWSIKLCVEKFRKIKKIWPERKRSSAHSYGRTWLYLVYLNSISVKMMNRYVFLCVSNVFQYV